MKTITTTPKQLTALLKHFGASDIREKTNNILDFLAGYEHGHDHGHDEGTEQTADEWAEMLTKSIEAYVRDHAPQNIEDPLIANQLRILWIAGNEEAKNQAIEQVKKYTSVILTAFETDKTYMTKNGLDSVLLEFAGRIYKMAETSLITRTKKED